LFVGSARSDFKRVRVDVRHRLRRFVIDVPGFFSCHAIWVEQRFSAAINAVFSILGFSR